MSASAIPQASTILVTGANGHIASHVVDQLLKAGYKVKGTVRSEEKGTMIAETLEKRHGKGKFSFVLVEDMTAEGAFDNAIQGKHTYFGEDIPNAIRRLKTKAGCAGVAHVASDLTFRDDPNVVITPIVAGVKNLLKAAASTPTVKRFVLTSSVNSITLPQANTKYHIDSKGWNDISSKEAWKTEGFDPAARGMHVYSASKVESERLAWKFMEEEKPQFVLNTVCPNFNIGEILDQRQPGSSSGYIRALWGGNPQITGVLQHFPPQYAIDVKDDARLHVAALTMDDVKGERLLALTEPFNYSRWIESLKKIDPSKEFPPAPENEGRDLSTVDMGRSVELLNRMGISSLTPLDESVRQMVESVS